MYFDEDISLNGLCGAGESWVGVSSVSVSHLSTSPRESHSSTPEHRPQVERSVGQVHDNNWHTSF